MVVLLFFFVFNVWSFFVVFVSIFVFFLIVVIEVFIIIDLKFLRGRG